jgi:DNA-binding NtrC family response regulator
VPLSDISRNYLPAEDQTRGIAETARRTDGNKAKAASLLGFSRQTRYRKLRGMNCCGNRKLNLNRARTTPPRLWAGGR